MTETDQHFFTEEWFIENFTCWNPRIHGVGILHKNVIVDKLNFRLELYPNGRNGDRMVARVYDENRSNGELSFVLPDGSVACRLEIRDRVWDGCYSVLPTELEFGEIVERSVREPSHKDVLTLRYRRRKSFDVVFRVHNRLDVIDTSIRIPRPLRDRNCKRSSILNFLVPDSRLVPLQFLVSTSSGRSSDDGSVDFEFMLLNMLKNNNHASNNHFFMRSCVYLLDDDEGGSKVIAFQENEHSFLNLRTWNFAFPDVLPEGVSLLVRLKFVTGGKSENYTGCWFQPHQFDVTMSESLWMNRPSSDFTTTGQLEEQLVAGSSCDTLTTGRIEELATMIPCDKVTTGQLEEQATISCDEKTTGQLEELCTVSSCDEVTTGQLEELAKGSYHNKVTTGPVEELAAVSIHDKVTTCQLEGPDTVSSCDKVNTIQVEELSSVISCDEVTTGQLEELATVSSQDQVTTGQLDELATVSSQDQVTTEQLDELATISSQNKVISGWLEDLATMSLRDEVTTGQLEEHTTTSSRNEATTQVDRGAKQEPLYNAFSDLQLRCGGETFIAHRAILSAHSPVFKSLLLSSGGDDPVRHVDIQDLDAATFCQFLFYLHTGGTADDDLQWEEALKLYRAAHLYQVPSLLAECSSVLTSSLAVSNVCDVLSLAEELGDDNLVSVAHDFVLKNYGQVVASEEWKCLKKSLLRKTLTKLADKVMVEDIFSDS